MCDALGTIIVDHLSKGELAAGNQVRLVRKLSIFSIKSSKLNFHPFFWLLGRRRTARTIRASSGERINRLINETINQQPPSNPFIRKSQSSTFINARVSFRKASSSPSHASMASFQNNFYCKYLQTDEIVSERVKLLPS